MGYIEMLGNSPLTAKQKYFTQNVKNSSEYISRLVQDLLDFSQIEAGKIAIENTSFSLPDMMDEIAKSVQSVFSHKKIALKITADSALNQNIIADPFRLKQVLTNIIGNAYKFTEEGRITINASVKNNTTVAITIQDSGIGIEEDSQDLVFEEFAQANENIEKKYGGTGLGLAISKKIISLLGGTLSLKESNEKGSAFLVELPLNYDDTILSVSTNQFSKIKPMGSKTIVVVDDDTDLLKLTTEVLRQHNYTVLPFDNAHIALKEMAVTAFDLVITDIQMPAMDGFTFSRAAKDIENYNDQPIVAVTGRNDLGPDIYGKTGFTTVIKKPYTTTTLLTTVSAVLNEQMIPIQQEVETLKEESELFTLRSLHSFLNNDNEAVNAVLTSFIESTTTNMTLLYEAIEGSDFEAVKTVAHRMAPMFKQIEATDSATILTNLEINDHSQPALIALFKTLEENVNLLVKAIQTAIN